MNTLGIVYLLTGGACVAYYFLIGLYSRFGLNISWIWPAIGAVLIAAGLLTLSVGSTAIAFIAQPVAQQYTTSNHVGVIFTLEPVFSTLAAIIVLNEIVSVREYLGAVLMVAAVILMNVDFERKDKNHEEDPKHL